MGENAERRRTQAELLQQRAAGFKQLHDGHFRRSIELLEEYFAALKPAAASDDRQGIIHLGRAYLGAGRVDDASALANEYCHGLKSIQPGRQFMMDVGTIAPDFMLTHMAISNAFDEDEAELFTIYLSNATKKYVAKKQRYIAQSLRKLRHLAGFSVSEQQEMLNVTIRKLPLADSIPAIEKAIMDPDLLGLVRTSLIVWLKQADVNAELTVYVAGTVRDFNPRWTPYPEQDKTILAVNVAVANLQKADIYPPDMILVLLSTVYPAVGDLITDPEEFAKEITHVSAAGKYSTLIKQMSAELQSLPM